MGHKRICARCVDKLIAVCSDEILEKVAQILNVFEFEYTEAYKNHELIVYVHKYGRCVFEVLFSDFRFDKNEYTEIQAPNYVVPAGTVPKTGCEPYEEEGKDGSSFSENGKIQ